MSKKKRKKQKYQGPKFLRRPEHFKTYTDCIKWLKKSVYMIARGRRNPVDDTRDWISLGSGFVVAPYRLITASHVINDPSKNDNYLHRDDDLYYLIRNDDEGNWHFRYLNLQLNKQIYLYPDIDTGIIYLDEEFYKSEGNIFNEINDYIRISQNFHTIGTEVGVLGYPLCNLTFTNGDASKPNVGDILLRTDKGVVNCRYQTSSVKFLYEFTMAFNPGNSGGPIFDIHTGQAISIVNGFKVIKTNEIEIAIPDENAKNLKIYKEKAYIETINATYSIGHATPTFLETFKLHKII